MMTVSIDPYRSSNELRDAGLSPYAALEVGERRGGRSVAGAFTRSVRQAPVQPDTMAKWECSFNFTPAPPVTDP
jgi:hypothetical protein